MILDSWLQSPRILCIEQKDISPICSPAFIASVCSKYSESILWEDSKLLWFVVIMNFAPLLILLLLSLEFKWIMPARKSMCQKLNAIIESLRNESMWPTTIYHTNIYPILWSRYLSMIQQRSWISFQPRMESPRITVLIWFCINEILTMTNNVSIPSEPTSKLMMNLIHPIQMPHALWIAFI